MVLNKYRNWRGRVAMLIVHLATLVDIATFFLTLSFYTTDLRATVLFSDWIERLDK